MKYIAAIIFILLSTFAYAEQHSVTVNKTAYSFTTKQDLKLFKNYYSKLGVGLDKLAEEMVKGRKEYLLATLREKKFATGRYALKTDLWKQKKVNGYWGEIANAFLAGKEFSGYENMVKRCKVFTQYIVDNYSFLSVNKSIYTPVLLIKSTHEIEKNNQVAEKNNQVAEKNNQVAEKLRKINEMLGK